MGRGRSVSDRPAFTHMTISLAQPALSAEIAPIRQDRAAL
jgi:hypothetical protein